MGKRTSFLWSVPPEELKSVVTNSKSFSDIMRYFGLAIASGNYKTLRKILIESGINYSHIPEGYGNNKNRKFPEKAFPLETVMVENSSYSRKRLKERLLNKKILENKCAICGLENTWNDKKLVMVLDHINGVSDDHRLENLRLLCPNCNSQQDTFCGKHNKTKRK